MTLPLSLGWCLFVEDPKFCFAQEVYFIFHFEAVPKLILVTSIFISLRFAEELQIIRIVRHTLKSFFEVPQSSKLLVDQTVLCLL